MKQAADAQTARLFFALWPDDAVRVRLVEAGRALHEGCGGRLMRPDTLHLTLLFLGDTPLARLGELCAAAGAVSGAPFTLRLSHLGWWPHNRIGWAAPGEVPEALSSLVANLTNNINKESFAFDNKKFCPHVTLLRQGRCGAIPPLPDFLWEVRDFVLLRSAPRPEGAAYEIVQRWPLEKR